VGVEVNKAGRHYLAAGIDDGFTGERRHADGDYAAAIYANISNGIQPGFRIYHPPAADYHVKGLCGNRLQRKE
jgi:hypothetical protein